MGGVLGGPIVQDKLWFFAGYLPQFIDTDRDVTFVSNEQTRSFTNETRRHFLMGKLSWRPADSLLVNLSYSQSPFLSEGQLPGRDGLGDADLDYSPIGQTRDKNSYSGTFQWTANRSVFVEGFAGYYEARGHELGIPEGDRRRFVTSKRRFSVWRRTSNNPCSCICLTLIGRPN